MLVVGVLHRWGGGSGNQFTQILSPEAGGIKMLCATFTMKLCECMQPYQGDCNESGRLQ